MNAGDALDQNPAAVAEERERCARLNGALVPVSMTEKLQMMSRAEVRRLAKQRGWFKRPRPH